MERIESVFMGKDSELLPLLFDFYAPDAQVVRDVTANHRRMWKGHTRKFTDIKWYDIDPSVSPDIVCDWNMLPDANDSVDVLVFDPPHLPVAAASEKSDSQYIKDYGLDKGTYGQYEGFLKSAKRVLVRDGVAFCKIKDFIHNHKYVWATHAFVSAAISCDLTACDHIIKRDPAGGNLKSSKWLRSYHARSCHCSWIVIRNGKCEPKKKS